MGARLPTGGFNVENWAAPRGASYFALTVNLLDSETWKLYFPDITVGNQWILYILPFNVEEDSNEHSVVESNVQLQLRMGCS